MIMQQPLGSEQASTTLNPYAHAPRDHDARVREPFDDEDPEDGR